MKNFSLSNEGNLLIIENPQKEYITSVNYSNSWYSKGREEGYSLEMIDESQACRGKENWASSVATIGATPGGANSVGKILIDTELPFPVSQNINGSILQIYFNENIDNKDFNIGNFEIISGDFSIQKVVFDKFSTDFVEIFIDRVIEEGESLELKLKTLTDCIGNLNTDIILSFSNVPAPQQGEILISEILFNPAVGGEDFVEIKNISEKPLNLKNWKLAKRAKDGSFSGISLISSKDLIVKPTEYLAFSKNKTAVLSQYPESSVPDNIRELSSFPSLNNDQDLVLLLNENELVMDSVFYEENAQSTVK
ncbi:MAG: lamin tail domain-containing protein [Cytophagaceae bacterium]|nr:lamin tail domain-containing protein [Cytophagaceae bacterium]